MKRRCLLVFTCIAACVFYLCACQEVSKSKEYMEKMESDSIQESSAAEQSDSAQLSAQPDRLQIAVLEHLLPDWKKTESSVDDSLLTKRWYKAGDMGTVLYFYLPDVKELDSGRLTCVFEIPTGQYASDIGGEWAITVAEQGQIQTTPDTIEYGLTISSSDDPANQSDYQIIFSFNGILDHIAVSGDGVLAGEYYTLDAYTFPDVFTRYLTETELCNYPTEVLYLLRNEIYAAHGRIFNSEKLRDYFNGKPWYRGTVAPENFQENTLSDCEKKNIALIQKLEKVPSSERSVLDGHSYNLESLKPAPYLSLLDDNRETGLSADLTTAKDMGIYTVVQGSLSVPLTVSPSQLDSVKQGEEVELVMNEATSETWILTTRTNSDNPTERGYVFYEKGTEPNEFDYDINFRINYSSGLYEMWQLSDDTVMKVVYEGDIYLLKGAVTGAYVSLSSASHMQEEIVYPEVGQTKAENAYDSYSSHIYGNCLRHNGRGYFTAVYYLGD